MRTSRKHLPSFADRMPRFPIVRAFTFVEVLCCLLVLSIIAFLGADFIGDTEASLRSEHAAQEALGAVRYARMESITTGTSYTVRFDTSARTISVLDSSLNVATQRLLAGGTFVIDLSNRRDLTGTTFTAAVTGDAANPYDVKFGPTGSTANPGTISFTYGNTSKNLIIPATGEPTLN
jgi:prepilin-type N-terminal cleavage/methylation domain-containing protein